MGQQISAVRRILVIFAVMVVAAPAMVCQNLGSRPGAELVSSSDPSSLFYPAGTEVVIRPYDVLRVKVFDVPELSGQYRVSPAGEITLPLLSKPIQAAGRTPTALSQTLSEELRADGLVSRPDITIEVKKSRLHSVVIGGAVNKPQIYPLFDHISLLDLLAQAGGLSKDAGDVAVITRQDAAGCEPGCGRAASLHSPGLGGRRRTLTISLKGLLDNSDSRLNVILYPGDAVTVERAGVIYVVGAVNRPGGFPLSGNRERVTVLEAIALAEGLKPTAVRGHSFIIRRNPNEPEGRQETILNLSQIFAGKAADPALQANDILFVPDSSSQKALRRAAEAAVEIASGVIIFRRP